MQDCIIKNCPVAPEPPGSFFSFFTLQSMPSAWADIFDRFSAPEPCPEGKHPVVKFFEHREIGFFLSGRFDEPVYSSVPDDESAFSHDSEDWIVGSHQHDFLLADKKRERLFLSMPAFSISSISTTGDELRKAVSAIISALDCPPESEVTGVSGPNHSSASMLPRVKSGVRKKGRKGNRLLLADHCRTR